MEPVVTEVQGGRRACQLGMICEINSPPLIVARSCRPLCSQVNCW